MLLKFASMFLANIFYYSKIMFDVKKRNARPSHFRILINKIYDIYFKIHGRLTNLELRHDVNKLIIFFEFLEYHSLLVRQRQNVILVTLNKFVNFLD